MSSSASVMIFQKTLQDLVKGIRSQKRDVSPYISKVIVEIKSELRSTDQFTKAEAVRKLTYLQMLGYDISFASFSIVEVMSSARFAHKRIGFLAASQSFNDATDVILLTTNLFKKEFTSMGHGLQAAYEVGLALNCLANVVTKDLARDCIGDVAHLMSSPEPYIRKKAVLTMFKLFVRYPQGLRLTFEQLKERLEDEHGSVVSSAVNVICELANRNPRNYIGMAPVFFRLLTTSSNNWMLIKVVKLFGSLVAEEPRLARKLLDPLMTIITSTSAKSLQFECISTVTLALPHTKRDDGSEAKNAGAALKVCSTHIRGLIKDDDQNLKYLGLVGLINLMKINPLVAVEHRDLVLQCLSDEDMTIKSRALELLAGMVTKRSLVDLVQHLLQHAEKTEGAYREEIVAKVLQMCMKDKHGLVSDFCWYISVLCSLSRLSHACSGESNNISFISDELVEIALRVEVVRPFAVESMVSLLLDEDILATQQRVLLAKILSSAAWVVGEYASVLTNIYHDSSVENEHRYYIEGPFEKDIVSNWRGRFLHYIVMRALLHPIVGGCLPSVVQAAYMTAAMKIFVEGVSACDTGEVASLVALLRVRFGDSNDHGTFAQSAHLEVEERKSFFLQLFYDLNVLFRPGHSSFEGAVVAQDLIEFSHRDDQLAELDSSQVIDEDRMGATNAIQKTAVLEALFAEPFYPVHAKAQRNVPVPPELNLNAEFNSRELNSFISGDASKAKLTLSTLSFVSVSESKPFVAGGYGNSYANDYYSGGGSDYQEGTSKISKVLGDISGSDYAQSTSATPLTAAATSTTKPPTEDNQMFYLNSGLAKGSGAGAPMQYSDTHQHTSSTVHTGKAREVSAAAIPLSELLASGHSNGFSPSNPTRKKHSKKSKSSKPRSAKHSIMQEVAPAGAAHDLVSSDDEKTKKKHRRKGGNKELDSEDEADLGNVDITQPLRPDEVIPVHKHRESVVASRDESRDEQDRKKKAKKQKKDKHKERDRPAADSNFPLGDLLGLEAPSAGATSPVPHQGEQHGDVRPSEPRGSKRGDGSKKKDVRLWRGLALPNTKDVRIYYSMACNDKSADSVDIVLCVINDHTVASGCTISAHASVEGANGPCSTKDVRAGVSGLSHRCSVRIPSRRAEVELPVKLSISVENLLGSASTQTELTSIVIHPSAAFQPFEVTEDEFADIISSRGRNKGCSYFGTASGTIRIGQLFDEEMGAKYALKALSAFMGGFVVHKEGSRAITICCRNGHSDVICCLVKTLRDDSSGEFSLGVDLKYMSGDESVNVDGRASDIFSSLRNLYLA